MIFQLKRVLEKIIFLTFLLFSSVAHGGMFTLTSAIQSETFVSDQGEDVSRMSLGAIGAEFEMNLNPKWSVGVLGGSQVSLTTQESLSFGIGGFANYYFKGRPVPMSFYSDSIVLEGMQRWAYFVGGGVEQRFLNSAAIQSEVRGGIFIRGGGKYIFNSKMFATGNLKYFMAGAEFSSMDITFGLGFFF